MRGLSKGRVSLSKPSRNGRTWRPFIRASLRFQLRLSAPHATGNKRILRYRTAGPTASGRHSRITSIRGPANFCDRLFVISPRILVCLNYERQLQSAIQHRQEVYGLIAQARRRFEAGEIAEGNRDLHHAAESNAGDPEIAASVANELVRYARKVFDTDWHTAEQMMADAVRLKPGLELPADLVASLQQVKREVELQDVLSFVDALISQQSWNDARLKLEKAQLRFAGEPRISERLTVVQNEIKQIELRQVREKVLADLRQVRSEAEATNKRKRLSVLLDATQRIGQLDYADDQIRTEAAAVIALLQAKISEQERRPKPPEPAPKPPALPTRIEHRKRQCRPSADFEDCARLPRPCLPSLR